METRNLKSIGFLKYIQSCKHFSLEHTLKWFVPTFSVSHMEKKRIRPKTIDWNCFARVTSQLAGSVTVSAVTISVSQQQGAQPISKKADGKLIHRWVRHYALIYLQKCITLRYLCIEWVKLTTTRSPKHTATCRGLIFSQFWASHSNYVALP